MSSGVKKKLFTSSGDKSDCKSSMDSGYGGSMDETNSEAVEEAFNGTNCAQFFVGYYGKTDVDKRYSKPMYSWVMAEVKRRGHRRNAKILIDNGCWKILEEGTNATLLQTRSDTVVELCKCTLTMHKDVFSLKCSHENDLDVFECHILDSDDSAVISYLSLNMTLQTAAVAKFQVLQVGKIFSDKKVISAGSVDKEVKCILEKATSGQDHQVISRSVSVSASKKSLKGSRSFDSSQQYAGFRRGVLAQHGYQSNRPNVLVETQPVKSKVNAATDESKLNGGRPRSSSDGDSISYSPVKEKDNLTNTHRRTSSYGGESAGHKAILHITANSIMVINNVVKTIGLEKTFSDISSIAQGNVYSNYFGFVIPDLPVRKYVGFLYKVESKAVADNIISTLNSAINTAAMKLGTPWGCRSAQNCEQCPMHKLHRLCMSLRELNPEPQHNILKKHINQMAEADKEEINRVYEVAKSGSIVEQNELYFIALRKLYEEKQRRHIHLQDLQTKPLLEPVQEETRDRSSSKIFMMKAKSFAENLIKGRSKTPTEELESATRDSENESPSVSPKKLMLTRQRSRTLDSCPPPMSPTEGFALKESRSRGESDPPLTPTKPKLQREASLEYIQDPPENHQISPIKSISEEAVTPMSASHRKLMRTTSWRQAIYQSVVSPRKDTSSTSSAGSVGIVSPSSGVPDSEGEETPKKTPEELRQLWKRAIHEQICLIRMDKENKRLRAKQDAAGLKRARLDYEELPPCPAHAMLLWDDILERFKKTKEVFDKEDIKDAVKSGVPRARRGEIWKFLLEQRLLRRPEFVPHWRCSEYKELRDVFNSHQHAILIDLGRTFPGHQYFTQQLGEGQVSLFNLLKAYAQLDPDVGYCQGLSFLAGMVLMHMEEEEAFDALCQILFEVNIRAQYTPDMCALQVQFYQMSRLLHDFQCAIHKQLESLEINPPLYGAGWFLTIFASQFPLGLVARIFDMILVDGKEFIFKVALVMLGMLRREILECDGFENTFNFLKESLPELVSDKVQRIIEEATLMDVENNLKLFEVEYQILKDDESLSHTHAERIAELETANAKLTKKVTNLTGQLRSAHARVRQLEDLLMTRANKNGDVMQNGL